MLTDKTFLDVKDFVWLDLHRRFLVTETLALSCDDVKSHPISFNLHIAVFIG